jgi:hypothetical protein
MIRIFAAVILNDCDCSSWPPIPYSNISNLLITDDISGQDFIGILLGDVDGNWGQTFIVDYWIDPNSPTEKYLL